MKLTPDFKARQCQLRTVCRRFSPKKRKKIRQKNQKGRSLKRTVLKPSAHLWFLIISYNNILLFIQSALSYFFYFFFHFCFPEHKWNRGKFIDENRLSRLNLAPPSKNCPLQHIFKYMFWRREWKFHEISHPLCQIYHCLHFACVVIKEREKNHEAMITFTMCSERLLAWKNCAVFKVYR